eukprot:gene16217-22381_t
MELATGGSNSLGRQPGAATGGGSNSLGRQSGAATGGSNSLGRQPGAATGGGSNSLGRQPGAATGGGSNSLGRQPGAATGGGSNSLGRQLEAQSYFDEVLSFSSNMQPSNDVHQVSPLIPSDTLQAVPELGNTKRLSSDTFQAVPEVQDKDPSSVLPSYPSSVLPSVNPASYAQNDGTPHGALEPMLVQEAVVPHSPGVVSAQSESAAGSTDPDASPLLFFKRLSKFRPSSFTDHAWQLNQVCRYEPNQFQRAADSAVQDSRSTLEGLTIQEIAYVASAYAVAQHESHDFMQTLGAVAAEKISVRIQVDFMTDLGVSSPVDFMTDLGGSSPVGSGGQSLTLRSSAALSMAFARLGCTNCFLRSGAVGLPTKKDRCTWICHIMWAFARLHLYDRRLCEEV